MGKDKAPEDPVAAWLEGLSPKDRHEMEQVVKDQRVDSRHQRPEPIVAVSLDKVIGENDDGDPLTLQDRLDYDGTLRGFDVWKGKGCAIHGNADGVLDSTGKPRCRVCDRNNARLRYEKRSEQVNARRRELYAEKKARQGEVIQLQQEPPGSDQASA